MILIITLLIVKAFCSQALFDSGVQAYNNKNYSQAGAYFEELLEKKPNDANLLYNLGIIKYKANKIDQAVGFLNAALFRGHELANQALEKIRKTHEIEIYKYNLKDRIFDFPLSMFLFIYFLFIVIFYSRFIVLFNKKPKLYFRKFIFSWTCFFVLSGIILIKLNIDNQILAVSKQNTSLYTAPDKISAPISNIPIGRRITVKKLDNDWAFVKDQNNTGWILKDELFYINHIINKQ